jgi:hypothetical protein
MRGAPAVTIDFRRICQDHIRKYGTDEKHLSIFRDLYSDRTHFVYELIQNADDAGAKRIEFSLFSDRIEVEHNGRRFTDNDVRSICSVANSTKENDNATIGKFGIGFKSVYAYTRCPRIHDRKLHFAIKSYVRPFEIPCDNHEADNTLFILPFDGDQVLPTVAYEAISNYLQHQLDRRTLLFLHSLTMIAWTVYGHTAKTKVASGTCSRRTTQTTEEEGHRIQVVTLSQSTDDESPSIESWMCLTHPGSVGTPPADVSLAFRVGSDVSDPAMLDFEPIHDATLSAHFLTSRPSHTRFVIQAPFSTTPSRDNVHVPGSPKGDANAQLIQGAAATLRAMPALSYCRQWLRHGLADCLVPADSAVDTDVLLKPIGDALLWLLTESPVLLAAASADDSVLEDDWVSVTEGTICGTEETSLMALLANQQLARLTACDERKWVSSEYARPEHRDLREFLIEHGLQQLGFSELMNLLSGEFLKSQSDEWLRRLYVYIAGQSFLVLLEQRARLLRLPLLRDEAGLQVAPVPDQETERIYIPPSGKKKSLFRTVRHSIVYDDRDSSGNAQIFEFLQQLGLAEPDCVDEVTELVLSSYETERAVSDLTQYHEDARDIRSAYETVAADRRFKLLNRLNDSAIVCAGNCVTGELRLLKPRSVFIDMPWLRTLYESDDTVWLTTPELAPLGESLVDALEVRKSPIVMPHNADPQGHVPLKSEWGNHSRGLNGFDPDARVDGLEEALKSITVEKAHAIWTNIVIPCSRLIAGSVEHSRYQTFIEPKRTHSRSILGEALIAGTWLPDRSGQFHKPHDMRPEDLPSDYPCSEEISVALCMKSDVVVQIAREKDEIAKSIGLPRDVLDQLAVDHELQELICKQVAQYRRLKERQVEQSGQPSDVRGDGCDSIRAAFKRRQRGEPTGGSATTYGEDPDKRSDLIRQEIDQQRHSGRQQRRISAQFSRAEVKDSALREFFVQEYGGHCQVCNKVFYKLDGKPYFETIYVVPPSSLKCTNQDGILLCLCPTCAAKFLWGSVVGEGLVDDILATDVEAGILNTFDIELCGEEVELSYTSNHLVDLKAYLKELKPRSQGDA